MSTATREHPIPFRAPMVRALLAGRKTQDRRIVKPQPDLVCKDGSPVWLRATVQKEVIRCPYGLPGDTLWVRESFLPCWGISQLAKAIDDATYVCFRDGSQIFRRSGEYHQWDRPVNPASWPVGAKWRPSIHMPRWASRITLVVADIRVERLQAITEADAVAEGVDAVSLADVPRQATWSRRQDFAQLWDKINGAGSWASDPWVWVVAFRRIEGGGA